MLEERTGSGENSENTLDFQYKRQIREWTDNPNGKYFTNASGLRTKIIPIMTRRGICFWLSAGWHCGTALPAVMPDTLQPELTIQMLPLKVL